ncbi:MAG: radical SAM family heme chaperone HemW [Acidobacteriota bacterium]
MGLYLHIPFCVKKCPYCDFISGPVGKAQRHSHLKALKREIRHSSWAGSRVHTVFLGGGTPSELTLTEMAGLVSALRETFALEGTREWTLECNPGTVSLPKLAAIRHLGFNRLSLGVQSFNDGHLRALGRIHDSQEARQAMGWSRQAGFENLNLDLIFALPGQTPAEWRMDLEEALEFGPEHLSLYNLTIEPGTPFATVQACGELRLPEEETAAEMFEMAMDLTAKAGYRHYEISNYARRGYECAHNQIYWRNQPYLGFGLGAASFMDGVRWANTASFSDYALHAGTSRVPRLQEERLEGRRAAGEEVMLRLRTAEGVRLDQLSTRYGLDLSRTFSDSIDFFLVQGLLERQGDRIFLTRRGKLLANPVCAEFL